MEVISNLDTYYQSVRLRKLTEIQKLYLADQHRFIVNSAGRRARKTIIGTNKVLVHVTNSKTENKNYYLLAPTRLQAKRIFWGQVKKKLRFVEKDLSESELKIVINETGNTLIVDGLDRAERLEGNVDGVHGIYIAETGDIKEDVLFEHLFPMLAETNGFGWFDGTPDYRSPFYKDLAQMACGCNPIKAEAYKGIKIENPENPEWVYYNWQSIDVLGEKVINEMKAIYDPMIFRQEFEGEFIEAGGLVYYSFSYDNLLDIEFEPNRHTVFCYDFNVDPMTILVNQEIEPNKWCVVKEFVLNNSNTENATNTALQFLKDNNFSGKLQITGDYTGTARKTVGKDGSRSDWEIIRRIMRGQYGFERERISSVSNHLKDGINSLNALFCTMDGNRRQFINKKNCQWLYKDLTRQTYQKDGSLNDESGTLGHRSDALMYFAYNFYRIRKEIERINI